MAYFMYLSDYLQVNNYVMSIKLFGFVTGTFT
jgi:hypothetical protein